MEDTIQFKLNGQPVSLKVDGERTLLWVLRGDLGVTGPKYGCGEGICGACTVLVNEVATLSCQTPVKAVNGQEIVTIEGLAKDGSLSPVQRAFIKHDAMQCGFCTPGMIMKAHSLLAESHEPTREEVIEAMEDNLCRCGAHTRIVEAVLTAAKEMKGGK